VRPHDSARRLPGESSPSARAGTALPCSSPLSSSPVILRHPRGHAPPQ
jgi:hypothetical protein